MPELVWTDTGVDNAPAGEVFWYYGLIGVCNQERCSTTSSPQAYGQRHRAGRSGLTQTPRPRTCRRRNQGGRGCKRTITIAGDPVAVFVVEAGEHIPTERGRVELRRAVKLDVEELRVRIDLRGPPRCGVLLRICAERTRKADQLATDAIAALSKGALAG